MGKVTNGANGKISGKVGSVVFCRWKDIDYVRGLPRFRRKRKPTEDQAKQRSKFSFMQNILGSFVPLVRLGFMNYAPNRTGHNSAMSYNIKNAIATTEKGFEVIPENFMISGGMLPSPREASVKLERNELIFQWAYDDTTNEDRNHALDRTLLLITDFVEQPNYTTSGNSRDECEDRLSLPSKKYNPGTILHAYMAFFATNGSNESSNSVYVGSVEV